MNETAIVKIEEHRNEKVGRRRETGKTSRQITQAQCIQTKRLELRPYRKSDTEQLMRLLTNEKITKTFMVPDFEAEEQLLGLASKLIAFSQREDTAHLEYGIYLKDALIGFINDCGMEGDEIEIGYVIHPDYEGRMGSAQEIIEHKEAGVVRNERLPLAVVYSAFICIRLRYAPFLPVYSVSDCTIR